MMRSRQTLFGLLFLLGACGEDAPPVGAASPSPGAPSGIEACDAFVKAACECADTSSLPIKDTCAIARQSVEGWRAIADIPEQRDAAASSCEKAQATLAHYGCGPKP